MIRDIIDRALNNERLTHEDGLTLFESKDILQLGDAAQKISKKMHPERRVTYIVDRNINYTNICVSECTFCAFYKEAGEHRGYVITKDELTKKIEETKELGGSQILLQGGLHPDLTMEYYEDLVRFIRSFDIHVHGFSPPEIAHMATQSGITTHSVLSRLKTAGLGTIPGGGAEILVDDIRKRISPNKCTASDWITVMEEAHGLGIRSSATMMYGHLESFEQRIDHLLRLRDLQDKTGGFTAFIPWSFQEENTKLKSSRSSGFDYLKTVAISRLMLDNFDNIQASWVTQGGKVAQLALYFGANDMGSTMIEENVVAAAGVHYRISEDEIRDLISDAGFTPSRRNTFYQLI